MQGISIKQERRREQQSKLEARQCQLCGKWFTVKKVSREICFRCEAHER